MDLKEVGCKDVDWFHLVHNRDKMWAVLYTVMNVWVSNKCGKYLD
jgi:hypothetical protein